MAVTITHEALMYAVYFAPRGKRRLLNLGHQLGQRHLSPMDKLIGVIGDAGAGKSLLIRGMFPGLELTNDDTGINIRPLPLLAHFQNGSVFISHTYHVDIRFEMAFTAISTLVEAIKAAIAQDRRVIIEHFELIYPYLNFNAEVLIGIGEEVIVTRPNIFGPLPTDIVNIVFNSLHFRRMAHTAEDLTGLIISKKIEYKKNFSHDDVKHGFVLEFEEKPSFKPEIAERYVLEYIDRKLDINYSDEGHILIGEEEISCTGPRIHVRNTFDIKNFSLINEFKYDPITRLYLLVGLVGPEHSPDFNDLNDLNL